MKCPVINNSTSFKIRAVIRFLHANNVSVVDIHHELYVAYSQSAMSVGIIWHWRSVFKCERTNKCSRRRAIRSAICSEWWPRSEFWPRKLRKLVLHNFRTFVWAATNCALFSLTLSQWDPAITSFAQDGFRWCSSMRIKRGEWLRLRCWLWLLDRYHKKAMIFSVTSYIITNYETWISFANVEGIKK
jgi:hypothetical protein